MTTLCFDFIYICLKGFFVIILFRLNTDKHYLPKVGKLVLMVIDAIRYDFLYGEYGEVNMLYSAESISNGKACLFKLRANAPTVTMPRIKVNNYFYFTILL